MDTDSSSVYESPKGVANRLGVSLSGLRRLAAIYESVHGVLPKDQMGGRLWSAQAVARLEAAKSLVDAGRIKSIKEALERPPGEIYEVLETLPPRVDAAEAFVAVLEELRAMREELAALKRQNDVLHRQLEAPTEGALEDAELRRMNQYLLGELERRKAETGGYSKRRPWWRFWGHP